MMNAVDRLIRSSRPRDDFFRKVCALQAEPDLDV